MKGFLITDIFYEINVQDPKVGEKYKKDCFWRFIDPRAMGHEL
jgi:hypothetical protein